MQLFFSPVALTTSAFSMQEQVLPFVKFNFPWFVALYLIFATIAFGLLYGGPPSSACLKQLRSIDYAPLLRWRSQCRIDRLRVPLEHTEQTNDRNSRNSAVVRSSDEVELVMRLSMPKPPISNAWDLPTLGDLNTGALLPPPNITPVDRHKRVHTWPWASPLNRRGI
jgi:hypothetical protein